MRGFNYRKTVQALNYFAELSGGELNKMKALKLIWLSDKLHLLLHGRPITGDCYYAMKNGPVASFTKDILEQNSISLSEEELAYTADFIFSVGYDFRSRAAGDKKVFSKTDLSVLDSVFNAYSRFDQFELSDISHEFQEWKQYESALNKKIASRFDIKLEELFYDAPPDHPLFHVDDFIKECSREIFEENKKVLNILK